MKISSLFAALQSIQEEQVDLMGGEEAPVEFLSDPVVQAKVVPLF